LTIESVVDHARGVKLGYHTINTLDDLPLAELARHLEDRGFESLWVAEHTHIPTSRRTPYPGGGQMPEQYTRMLDPVVSLTAAALATRTLRLGTAALLPLQRDLFVLAKEIATLDHLSNGRVILGVGAGWNREELADHTSIPWSERRAALVEAVQVLRALWTEPEPAFRGRYFSFEPVWANLKPLQRPHPPILMGFTGASGRQLAAAWSDGWMPLDFRLGTAPERIAAFRQEVADLGRDPGSVEITIVAGGDPTPESLQELSELGVARVVLGVERFDWDDPHTTVDYLDRYAPAHIGLAGEPIEL
jgi:probable F420-dependent oxidoreductase